MTIETSARMALRAATASHHHRVDSVFSRAELGDRASYGRFLLAQAAAHLPVEAALARGGVADIVPDWDARQRSALLCADLAGLGLDVPEAAGAIEFEGEAAMLGALYVLEGSRLGGTVLKRSVAPDFPAHFLGGVDSGAWRSLLALLDERLDTESKRSAATRSACRVFELFETGGQRHFGMK